MQISPSLATKSLGHSLMVHTTLYHRCVHRSKRAGTPVSTEVQREGVEG